MLQKQNKQSKLWPSIAKSANAMSNSALTKPLPTAQKAGSQNEAVSPAEIAAVEAALRQLETMDHKPILGQIAQWFLVLKMYKRLEVGFQSATNRPAIASQHRALLSALMGIGEWFWNESAEIPPETFALISYSRESLAANVKYLHEKYEQWFVEIDEHEMTRVMGKLADNRDHPKAQAS